MTDKQKILAKFLDQSTVEGGVDFHLHSHYSDGKKRPAEIVRAAWEAKLRALAITDHDSLGGISEALAEQERQLKEKTISANSTAFVAGIEISTRFADSEIHILAYFPEKPPAKMYEFIAEVQRERRKRNRIMVKKVKDLGYDLSSPDPGKEASEDAVWGRMHLARQLVRDGHFDSNNQAFAELLTPGKPGYIARRHFTAQETLEAINAANGVAVLAHPHEYKFCPASVDDQAGVQLLSSIFRDLKALGLHGIEAFHGMVGPEHAYLFYKLARELDLVVTQGSDNHGEKENDSHHSMYSGEVWLYRDYVLSRGQITE
ncbi:MAG: PHP domain-containing protein [Fastidiosipila sp.]|nr:PHP domain-containing protein [Fastidiosipila sp.]